MKFVINLNNLTLNKEKLILNKENINLLLSKNIPLSLDMDDSDENNLEKEFIVLFHGNMASKSAFNELIEFFKKYFRVISFDLLGHGNSSKISEVDNLSQNEKHTLAKEVYHPCVMIAEVMQLLESKNVRNAHFIAWGLGGCIANGIAIDNEKLVSSVTLIGSPPTNFGTRDHIKGFTDFFINSLAPQWMNHPAKYSEQEAKDLADRVGFTGEEKFINDVMQSDELMRKAFFEIMGKDNANVLKGEEFIRSTDLPVCLIVGSEDKGMNSNYIQSFNGKLKNTISEVHTIRDSKHAVFKTNHKIFSEISYNFINKVLLQQKQNNILESVDYSIRPANI